MVVIDVIYLASF